MTYNELQDYCKKRKLQVKDVLNVLGMTYIGLKDSLDKNTLPVKKLIPLCQVLHISPNEFVGWQGMPQSYEYDALQSSNTTAVTLLKEQLTIKDSQISNLILILKNQTIKK